MASEPRSTPPAADRRRPPTRHTAFAAWIAAEPVPALRACGEELSTLAGDGQGDTSPLTEQLEEVLGTLEDVASTLRDPDAAPATLRELLLRCSSDLDSARALAAQSRLAAARNLRIREDTARILAGAAEARERAREAREDGHRRG